MKWSWLQMVTCNICYVNFFHVYKNKSGSGIFRMFEEFLLCLIKLYFNFWLKIWQCSSSNRPLNILTNTHVFVCKCLRSGDRFIEEKTLLLAVRSFVFFSQLSAWLSVSHGAVPRNILYRYACNGKNWFAVCTVLQLVLKSFFSPVFCLLLEGAILLPQYFGSSVGFVYCAKYSSCWCF